MKQWEEAVNKFINQKSYLQHSDVVGIILHGSYLTGYNHDNSDIDILVIKVPCYGSYESNTDLFIRGATTVDGYKIEYFEKPIDYFYLTMRDKFKIGDFAHYNIICKGKTLFDSHYQIRNLKKEINRAYKQYAGSLNVMNENEAKKKICVIDNRILKLEVLGKTDDTSFKLNYYDTLSYMQRFYVSWRGLPSLPLEKINKLYHDPEYSQVYTEGLIPEERFVELFSNCFEPQNNQDAMDKIIELYSYIKGGININPKEYVLSYEQYR